MEKIEIMAPAGSYEALAAAINAGTNSVYFGIEHLNMRARAANNFTTDDLRKIVSICQEKNVKTYLTLNTVMYDNDLELMRKICDTAKEVNLTAVIASDIAVMQYANNIGVEVHISTQANVSNFETVKFYSQFADVIVLARELSIEQIKSICEQVKENNVRGPNGNVVGIEIFVHGALCVSISGKCYMSLHTYASSANRGACLQNCRRKYRVIDEETKKELVLDNKYVMSPKDLCTIGFIDKIIDTGITVLKIEGRGRSPDYVYTVVQCYREAVDSYTNRTYNKEKIELWKKRLGSVYNRGFWHGGYYLGKKVGEWSGKYGSQATKEKVYIGIIENYYAKPKVASFLIETGEIKGGDTIIIIGPTTGVVEEKVTSVFVNEKPVDIAKKGDVATVPITTKVRKNDKLYMVRDRTN